MKDTNQASELFSLCKKVYERTGWEDVRDFYHENDTFDEETQTFKRNGVFSIVERKRADYNTPLYTSDYLLEKLPQSIDAGRSFAVDMFLVLDRPKSLKYRYRAFYTAPSYGKRHEVVADTPLKALLKLTIALSEAGELNG